jgi:hypothetical protein
MALFPTGSLQEKMDFFYQKLKKIPTSDQVKNGLAFDAKAIAKMQQALDYNDFGEFEKLYNSQNKNWEGALAHAQAKLSEAETNVANLSDTRSLSAADAARVANSGELAAQKAKLQELRNNLGQINSALGTSYGSGQVLVRDKNGNYVPTSEANRNQTVGRSGEPVNRRTAADGSIEIYGTRSGQVIKTLPSGTSDAEVSRAMTEMQSGFAEPLAQGGTATSGSAGGSSSSGSITGSQAGDKLLGVVSDAVAQKTADAEAKGIQITPEIRAQYLAQAWDEQAPYYGELIRNAEFDLGTSLSRIVQDAHSGESAISRQYQKNLETTQGTLKDNGMLYGGVRNKAERTLAEDTNTQLQNLDTTFGRNLQDTSNTAERYLGTDTAKTYGDTLGKTTQIGRVLQGSPTFQAGQSSSIFKPQGTDQYGSLNRDITYSKQSRANELETAERDRFSQFN